MSLAKTSNNRTGKKSKLSTVVRSDWKWTRLTRGTQWKVRSHSCARPQPIHKPETGLVTLRAGIWASQEEQQLSVFNILYGLELFPASQWPQTPQASACSSHALTLASLQTSSGLLIPALSLSLLLWLWSYPMMVYDTQPARGCITFQTGTMRQSHHNLPS